MVNTKSATIIIALLAFAVMYSTFVTETGLTTGRYSAGEFASDNNPVTTYSEETNKPHPSNTPFKNERTIISCIPTENGVIYGKSIYENECISANELRVYYCAKDRYTRENVLRSATDVCFNECVNGNCI